MSAKAPALADFRRIVVKVGSSLLVDAKAGRPREAKIKNREDLPMRRRHYEAYVVPHQID